MTFDPGPYAARMRRENEVERRRIADAVELALAEAHRLANEIRRADAGVRAVYLFGSLARTADGSGPRHLDFDIDLALDGGDVYAAEEVAESAAFPVDLVSLERLPEPVQSRIRETGVVL